MHRSHMLLRGCILFFKIVAVGCLILGMGGCIALLAGGGKHAFPFWYAGAALLLGLFYGAVFYSFAEMLRLLVNIEANVRH